MLIKKFSDLTLSKAGVRARFEAGACLGAHFRLDNDVSRLFPYINAAVQGARLYDRPDYIQFDMDDVQCTLYPRDVMAVPFENQAQADRFCAASDRFSQQSVCSKGYRHSRLQKTQAHLRCRYPQTPAPDQLQGMWLFDLHGLCGRLEPEADNPG